MLPDVSGKVCHTLNSELDEEAVAQVCVELVNDPHQFQVTFNANGEWKLITNKFWMGADITTVPKLSNGMPDLARGI